MNILAVIVLAMALGGWIFYTVQEKQKEAEKQKQEQAKINAEIEKEAMKTMVGSLLKGYLSRNGAFKEDSVFQEHPNPNHLRVVMDQGRARIIWERALKGVTGSEQAEAREINDLLAEINLDLPDYLADLQEETRKLQIKVMEIKGQYRDLCAKNPTEQVMLQAHKLNDEYEQINKKIAINGKLVVRTASLRCAGIKRSGRDVVIGVIW